MIDRKEAERQRYQRRKEAIRTDAIDFIQDDSPLSWGELADRQQYFLRLGRRYGLLQEFRENGIC